MLSVLSKKLYIFKKANGAIWCIYALCNDYYNQTHQYTHYHHPHDPRMHVGVADALGHACSEDITSYPKVLKSLVTVRHQNCKPQAGEVVQQLRTLAILTKDLGLVPSAHKAAYNLYNSRGL